MELDHIPT